MSNELINADFTKRVVVRADETPWIPSPLPGVDRRPLDRIGGEVARATTIVRYAPNSHFSAHTHDMGEEYLVLDGVFADEHGDYPTGAYVRNPPGSSHAPKVGPGCTILVKLRQMPDTETERVLIDTNAAEWRSTGEGRETLSLYDAPDGSEQVSMERLAPGATLPAADLEGGEELFVVSGAVSNGDETYGPNTWIRTPAGRRESLSSAEGAVYWVKRGHLPAAQ